MAAPRTRHFWAIPITERTQGSSSDHGSAGVRWRPREFPRGQPLTTAVGSAPQPVVLEVLGKNLEHPARDGPQQDVTSTRARWAASMARRPDGWATAVATTRNMTTPEA